jgi:hypothetical protein
MDNDKSIIRKFTETMKGLADSAAEALKAEEPPKADQTAAGYLPFAAEGLVSDPLLVPPAAARPIRKKRAANKSAAGTARKSAPKTANKSTRSRSRKAAGKSAAAKATRRIGRTGIVKAIKATTAKAKTATGKTTRGKAGKRRGIKRVAKASRAARRK